MFSKVRERNIHVLYVLEVSMGVLLLLVKTDLSLRANDYSSNDCKSPLKAILLNKVVVGKGCKMLHDTVTLTSPPSGYDSV